MIDSVLKGSKALSFGLFLLLFITACLSQKSPEETTISFWSAIANNDLDLAKSYCSAQSQCNLSPPQAPIKNATFNYRKIVINGQQATVETEIISVSNKKTTFTTFLIKENDHWTVDYQRSSSALSGSQLFKSFFNSLSTLGDTINKQLEQQLPIIEKEIESFSEQLKQHADDFEKELKKSFPQKQLKKYPPESI